MPVSTPQINWPRFFTASSVALFTSFCAVAGPAGASSQASAQQPAVAKERNRNITPSVYRGFNPFRP